MPTPGQVLGGTAILGGLGIGGYALYEATRPKPVQHIQVPAGAKGARGARGLRGVRGIRGVRGARGPAGPPGVTRTIITIIRPPSPRTGQPGHQTAPPNHRRITPAAPPNATAWPYHAIGLGVTVEGGALGQPATIGSTVAVITRIVYAPPLRGAARSAGVVRLIVRNAATGAIVQQGPWRPAPGLPSGPAARIDQRTCTWKPRSVGLFELLIEVRNPITHAIVRTWRRTQATSRTQLGAPPFAKGYA